MEYINSIKILSFQSIFRYLHKYLCFHAGNNRSRSHRSWLDGKLYLTHELPQPVTGRVGLWSKADSVVYFDDYRVVTP